ncbi:MAG: ABC transporter ATP-binding protein [Thermotogae bacterium]|nr:ABC transporter ATP-binding protein [Thermotogota bacterium]
MESLKVALRNFALLFRIAPWEVLMFMGLMLPSGLAPGFVVRFIGEGEALHNPVLLIVAVGLLVFMDSITYPLNAYISGNLTEKFSQYMAEKIFMKLEEFRSVEQIESPDVHNRLEVIKSMARFAPANFLWTFSHILKSVLTIASISVVLFRLNPVLPFIIVLALLPYSIVWGRFSYKSWWAIYDTSLENRRMNYTLSVVFTFPYIYEILSFGAVGLFMNRFNESYRSFHDRMRRIRGAYLLKIVPAIIFGAVLSITAVYLGFKGRFLGSTVLSFVYLQEALLSLIAWFSEYSSRTLGTFKELEGFINMPVRSTDKRERIDPEEAAIKCENLRFTYDGKRYVLDGINITIPKGQKVAFVGHNGAGKTTLCRIILGLYGPTEGKIKLFSDRITMAFQNFGRYKLSLRDNVVLSDYRGDDHIDHSRLEEVLRRVGIDFPPDTQIGREFGGIEPSGGEWQRIALARTLYKEDADIVIFDEPTENLDPEAEYGIFNFMMNLYRDKTLILVTHRLWSVRNVDRIFVFKEGKVVEEGTHEELLRKGGEYAKMWQFQLRKYGLSA